MGTRGWGSRSPETPPSRKNRRSEKLASGAAPSPFPSPHPTPPPPTGHGLGGAAAGGPGWRRGGDAVPPSLESRGTSSPAARPASIQDQLRPRGARGGGRRVAGPGAPAMARGAGGGRTSRGRSGVGARGGRRGARRAGAGGAAGLSGRQVPGADRAAAGGRGTGTGTGRGRCPAWILDRLVPPAAARGAGSARRGLRRSGAPGGAGTCGGGETQPRRVRAKAVLILTPNVFGGSCRRGGDRLAAGGW